jgi:hypothetical protein
MRYLSLRKSPVGSPFRRCIVAFDDLGDSEKESYNQGLKDEYLA